MYNIQSYEFHDENTIANVCSVLLKLLINKYELLVG